MTSKRQNLTRSIQKHHEIRRKFSDINKVQQTKTCHTLRIQGQIWGFVAKKFYSHQNRMKVKRFLFIVTSHDASNENTVHVHNLAISERFGFLAGQVTFKEKSDF